MNLQSRVTEAEQFQIAPMIDIVFVVLVFFLATYAVAEKEKRFEVKLPETTAGDPVVFSRQQVVIHLDQKGRVFLEKRQVQLDKLELRLRKLVLFAGSEEGKPSVIIRADGRCLQRDFMRVMDACKRAGITKFNFASVDRQEGLRP